MKPLTDEKRGAPTLLEVRSKKNIPKPKSRTSYPHKFSQEWEDYFFMDGSVKLDKLTKK